MTCSFVLAGAPRVLLWKKIRVGLADRVGRRVEAHLPGFGAADADVASVSVLEVDVVRRVGQQRIEQLPFLIQFGFGPFLFRDIPEDDLRADDPSRRRIGSASCELRSSASPRRCGSLRCPRRSARYVRPACRRAGIFPPVPSEKSRSPSCRGLLAWQAQQAAERLIGERDSSRQVLARHVDRQVLHQRAIERLEVLRAFSGLRVCRALHP